MEIEVSYRYSKVDKEPQFGIKFIEEREQYQIYNRWVFFYLGKHLDKNTIRIYPFSLNKGYFKGKILYQYKYCNDAQRQAKMICNKIIKQLEIYNSDPTKNK